MIISHVKIIAFQTIIIHCLWIYYIRRNDCSLYNKQNNTDVVGNTRFISLVKHDITFNTQNTSGISAHHVLFSIHNAEKVMNTHVKVFVRRCSKPRFLVD